MASETPETWVGMNHRDERTTYLLQVLPGSLQVLRQLPLQRRPGLPHQALVHCVDIEVQSLDLRTLLVSGKTIRLVKKLIKR